MSEYFSSAFVLIALFICFIGLVIWAWSKNRQKTFTHASHLPLEDDETYIKEETQQDISSSTTVNSDEK